MALKGRTVAAALVLLAPCVALAATEANFAAKTTGDLVELCDATPDNAMGTAAVNFCEGFAQGAVSVEMQNLAAFRGPKLFCMPSPLPSRNQALSDFVKWARMSPDRMSASSTDGLFRFLGERYPCPQSR
jgi:Rap1a immunity proteins